MDVTRTEAQLLRAMGGQDRRDRAFVLMLVALLGAMAWVVVDAAPPAGRSRESAHGVLRPVAPDLLREQLDSGRLSRHPASHWRIWPRGAPAPLVAPALLARPRSRPGSPGPRGGPR